ncbi:MAG: light-harvesting antenna LH1, beta subunit [Pseudomonadota bacterium]
MVENGVAGTAMNHTGLSDDECKEVHAIFVRGVVLWSGAAAVAHMLVWIWLPWFPVGG